MTEYENKLNNYKIIRKKHRNNNLIKQQQRQSINMLLTANSKLI